MYEIACRSMRAIFMRQNLSLLAACRRDFGYYPLGVDSEREISFTLEYSSTLPCDRSGFVDHPGQESAQSERVVARLVTFSVCYDGENGGPFLRGGNRE